MRLAHAGVSQAIVKTMNGRAWKTKGHSILCMKLQKTNQNLTPFPAHNECELFIKRGLLHCKNIQSTDKLLSTV